MNLRSLFTLSTMIVAASSMAAVVQYGAHLTGDQEVPGNPSLVTADITITIDTATFAYTVAGVVNGNFTSNIRDYHIHRGAFGTNGNVIIGFGAGAFSSATGGTVAHTGTIVDSVIGGSTVTAQQKLDYITSGNAYMNIHTVNIPSGEIRGQLEAVPEPATMAVLGLGSLLLLRRRRKA